MQLGLLTTVEIQYNKLNCCCLLATTDFCVYIPHEHSYILENELHKEERMKINVEVECYSNNNIFLI